MLNLGLTHLHGYNASIASGAAATLLTSVQSGTVTIAAGATSGTLTITGVDTALSHALLQGFTTVDATSAPNEIYTRVELTNTTTVTAYRNTSDVANAITARVAVLEWTSTAIQSIQAGSITIAAASVTNTAALSAVVTANSAILFLGNTTDSVSSAMQRYESRVAITSTTQVTATRDTGTDAVTVGYVVIEWKTGILNSSTQQGSIDVGSGSTSNTATVTAVTMNQCMVFYGGRDTTSPNMNNSKLAYIALTSTTQLTATRVDTTNACEVNFTLVEFKSSDITLIQRGTDVIAAAATTEDATITAVSALKGFVNYLGYTASNNNTVPNENFPRLELTSTTNVRGTRNTADATATVTYSFEAIDLI